MIVATDSNEAIKAAFLIPTNILANAWSLLSDNITQLLRGSVIVKPQAGQIRREDWGEAIDVGTFYGRQVELSDLERWLVEEKCRVVTISGMGGVGKTSLTIKLVQQIKDNFAYIFWRDLRNAPLLNVIKLRI